MFTYIKIELNNLNISAKFLGEIIYPPCLLVIGEIATILTKNIVNNGIP